MFYLVSVDQLAEKLKRHSLYIDALAMFSVKIHHVGHCYTKSFPSPNKEVSEVYV